MLAAIAQYSGNAKEALETGSFHFNSELMEAMIKLAVYAKESGVSDLLLAM